jgi:hypothetical protein
MPLTPDFGEPDPEEAISWEQLQSRMAAMINGQLLLEGKILCVLSGAGIDIAVNKSVPAPEGTPISPSLGGRNSA